MIHKEYLSKDLKINATSLYLQPRYSYLDIARGAIGNYIHETDILGEGENAVVIASHHEPKIAVKIKKPGNTDSLQKELFHHILFLEGLRNGKHKYKGQLGSHIKIPQLYSGVGFVNDFLRMEKVHGQSIKTKFYREYYNKELEDIGYSQKFLDLVSDNNFELILKHYKFYTLPPIVFGEDFDAKILQSKLTDYYNSIVYGTDLGNVMDFLEWKGLKHNDLHPGNIMLANNGDLYIIDFGKASFTPTQNDTKYQVQNIIQ